MSKPVEVVRTIGLKKYFPSGKTTGKKEEAVIHAVDGVSFTVAPAETLGLAGESGCGKTTTAKLLLKLFPPTEGQAFVNGVDITTLEGPALKAFRKNAQMVFQDPYESLNPRFNVRETLMEPLNIHRIGTKAERLEAVIDTMLEVGLSPPKTYLTRFPHELSGGQRQRVAIARALVLQPRFLIADEPVSMLDLSIRAGVLKLLEKQIAQRDIAGLCVSHDLSLLRYLCRRTAIMYLGRIVEIGSTEDILERPLHPYTQGLLAAVPLPDPDQKYRTDLMIGDISSAANLPSGCRFHPRCVRKMKICETEAPPSIEAEPGRLVECHLHT